MENIEVIATEWLNRSKRLRIYAEDASKPKMKRLQATALYVTMLTRIQKITGFTLQQLK